jgi:heterodisulfide reductase subunit D
MLLARNLMQGRIRSSAALEALRDGIFGCTLCGGCEEVCQVDIPFVEVYQCLRADFYKKGLWPEALNMARDTMIKDFNINGQPQMDRVEGWSYWHPDEDALLDMLNQEAKVGFFAGCASSFKGVPIQATIATSLIYEKAGVEYTMLGEEEWCCGAPVIMTGDFETAKDFANHNIEEFEKLGVEKVVTNCPGCYKMWAHEYHAFLGIDHNFEVLYGYQYLQELLDQNKLELTNPLDMTITYHDGCDAGRNSGFYEEPRKVIEYLPGVEFEELPHNKNNCYCCGSGGVLRAIDNEFAQNINKLKVDDIERTNAEYVVSGCPSCVEFMKGQLP